MPQPILYKLGYCFIRSYARLMLRMDIQISERPPEGPKLFVANHPSCTDAFLIHLLAQPMSVMITANAFSMPLFGFYLRRAEQICVMPGQGGNALEEARAWIRNGRSVAIFPEGHLSPQDGSLLPPKSGAARLALSTGVPVIPVGVYLPFERNYCIRSRRKGINMVGYWYLHGPYGMTVGSALRFEGDVDDRAQVQSVSATIMEKIAALAQESELRVRGRGAPAAVTEAAL